MADPHEAHAIAPLSNEFEIEIGTPDRPWHASNGRVGLTVLPDPHSVPSRKRLPDGRPVLIHKSNAIKHACTPRAHKVQWAVGELNGVKVYVQDLNGQVNIVVTMKDLNP